MLALAAGWAIARAPLTYGLAVCVGVPLVALSLWEPALGLGRDRNVRHLEVGRRGVEDRHRLGRGLEVAAIELLCHIPPP